MKCKRIDWDYLAPLGLGGRLTAKRIGIGLAASAAFAWILYGNRLARCHRQLYQWVGRGKNLRRELLPGAVMAPFYQVLKGSLMGFGVLMLLMLLQAIWHYYYHYQDSRSIYLMRRLPNRWELWRRCLALPLLGVAVYAAAGAAHLLIFYTIYHFSTPPQCLQSGQWRMLWENLVH